jgi:NADH:ubiquinone oxidoreductase subunit 5 (subunit L)/multisubunit Na+/H+ antiporter MnhA subunit
MLSFAWIILVFPILGLLINLTFGKRLGKSFIALVAGASVFASFLAAVGMAFALRQHERYKPSTDNKKKYELHF